MLKHGDEVVLVGVIGRGRLVVRASSAVMSPRRSASPSCFVSGYSGVSTYSSSTQTRITNLTQDLCVEASLSSEHSSRTYTKHAPFHAPPVKIQSSVSLSLSCFRHETHTFAYPRPVKLVDVLCPQKVTSKRTDHLLLEPRLRLMIRDFHYVHVGVIVVDGAARVDRLAGRDWALASARSLFPQNLSITVPWSLVVVLAMLRLGFVVNVCEELVVNGDEAGELTACFRYPTTWLTSCVAEFDPDSDGASSSTTMIGRLSTLSDLLQPLSVSSSLRSSTMSSKTLSSCNFRQLSQVHLARTPNRGLSDRLLLPAWLGRFKE
jgi:hypothetical protein